MIQKLGDVCDFYTGNAFPIKYQGKSIDELPFYKVGDIANNVNEGNVFLNFCGNYISRNEAKELKVQIVPRNTVVFAKIGEAVKLNRRAITSRDCLIDNNCMGIKPKGNLDLKYFYYFMKNLKMESLAEATAVPSVKKTKLENLKFEFPIKEEQTKIGLQLDKIYLVWLLLKKQLQSLDDLIKSRFVEMFGDPISNSKSWDTVELGRLTSVGSSKRIFEREYVTEGIPFYRTKEIVELSKGNSISAEHYITKDRFIEIKKQCGVPKKGDLLISAVGTIGAIWIVDGKVDFYFKDGNLIRIDGSNKFDSIYMKNLLEILIDEYKKEMSIGTAYSALTISSLSKMKVYNVPMNLQKQFSDFAEQINKSKFCGDLMIDILMKIIVNKNLSL